MSLSKLICGTLLFIPFFAHAMPIDRQLVIRPMQICNTVGVCANEGRQLYEDFDDWVWAQAGIDIRYEEFTQVIDPPNLDVNFTELFGPFPPTPGETHNWFESAVGGVPETDVINLWFTRSLPNPGSGGILGLTDGDADPTGTSIVAVRNNILINDDIFDFDYTDVLAHEIGHVLGLEHCGFEQIFFPPGYVNCPGATVETPSDLNLMTPSTFGGLSVGSVDSSGRRFASLTAPQIALARDSRFLTDIPTVPSPAPWALLLLSIVIMPKRNRLGESIAPMLGKLRLCMEL